MPLGHFWVGVPHLCLLVPSIQARKLLAHSVSGNHLERARFSFPYRCAAGITDD